MHQDDTTASADSVVVAMLRSNADALRDVAASLATQRALIEQLAAAQEAQRQELKDHKKHHEDNPTINEMLAPFGKFGSNLKVVLGFLLFILTSGVTLGIYVVREARTAKSEVSKVMSGVVPPK